MPEFYAEYCALISSSEQLEQCKRAHSLQNLLAIIKKLWHCPERSDNQLLDDIAQLNQFPITENQAQFAKNWLPYRYRPGQQRVYWLLPFGHATEPFQDETISRYRQQLINQIIQPCSTLAVAQQQAIALADAQPAGFIFHLSRCGSTLISGCLSELDSTCVFSESPLLTELLLDKNLSVQEQQNLLRAFINLQAAVFPNRPQVIIKWNAWDIFCWDLIHAIYPQVPVVFVVRNPVEILASHQKLAGRHMAGEPGLAQFNSMFSRATNHLSLLQYRTDVLRSLQQKMHSIQTQNSILCMDYSQLKYSGINTIFRYFDLTLTGEEQTAVMQRLGIHSKTPGVLFTQDSLSKQSLFSAADKHYIEQQLFVTYELLREAATCLAEPEGY
ncbi:sulfotransferase family protein [Cellvibrio sp. KY-YJ-3]|uniref:sulfotransferase family protein n=1 Tax=Cellvibrio sp. KY-YJ-3 TaxID=454662 RepID=UPI001246F9D9|nr:sulfotransferase family protein [Cellvibrio sp. KY-YJ-3]QEY12739.1 sulfotransferase family protein [Cellvibrio sp. KY-YJ-3]